MDLRMGWNFAIMLNFQIETAIFKDVFYTILMIVK